jgi:hypothetical protein
VAVVTNMSSQFTKPAIVVLVAALILGSVAMLRAITQARRGSCDVSLTGSVLRRSTVKLRALMLVIGACVGSSGFACTSSPQALPSSSPTDRVSLCIDRTEALHHVDSASSFMAIAGFDMANNNPPPAAVHLREVYDHVVAAGVVVASDTEASTQLSAAASTLNQAIREMKHERVASGKKLARLAVRQMSSARQLIKADAQCPS